MEKYTKISDELFEDVFGYLQDNLEEPVLESPSYVTETGAGGRVHRSPLPVAKSVALPDMNELMEAATYEMAKEAAYDAAEEAYDAATEAALGLPELEPEETFSEMLMRLIDEKGISDPDAYHKAWVDRRVFSKIRSNPDYTPLKKTAVAFALALELDRDTADELLMKAGYALSNSSRWDLIIRYCIEHKIYQLYQVNCILNDFEQPLLG